MNYLIRCIADHYGPKIQIDKTVEELSELIRALVRHDKANTIEEIADVEVMLEQIKYLLLIPDKELENWKMNKIQRTLGQIKEEKKGRR